ncbi:MAG: ASCH domain-containing protein [Minisyncoccia bacterium]
MKVVKFRQHFVPNILNGTKKTTWRLFDDKDLSVGDDIELVDFETKNKFGEARIEKVFEKEIKNLMPQEIFGHGYKNVDEMIERHKVYYGNGVNKDTKVKIITFELKK